MLILTVDDDEVALLALHEALTEAGHEVHAARNGREAMDFLTKHSCRLVISDWMMPEMDGLALCRAIRSQDQPAYVFFILLTSRDGPDNILEGLTAGADEFLTKPFNPAELIVRVRAAERMLSLDTRDLTIFALAKLAESRDYETGLHLERVRLYSRILAEEISRAAELDEEYIRLIYQTSPLHDIGKVGIPDRILLKPGRLNEDEFDVMKTHTTIGAETLDAALTQYPDVPFLVSARDIAATHHEHYDGGGYPRGLRGDEIPLCGRIVAVADVYDALTSKRVYKPAFAHERAVQIIQEGAGRQFDPLVVKGFLRRTTTFRGIKDKLRDESSAAPVEATVDRAGRV